MRLMYTTALASAVMFAGPALAAGDKIQGATGMTAPESSAAQIHGQSADSGALSQNFASAGFQNWQEAQGAQILRMQSGDGQPLWVVLMPDGFQVGAAESGSIESESGSLESDAGDLAEAPGSAVNQQDLPDVSQQAEAGDMPQRGEQADVSETFEGAEDGQQPDIAESSPEIGETDGQADIAGSPDLGQTGGPDLGETGGQADIAESPDLGQDRGQDDIAAGSDMGQQGVVGETEPEGFAAQIPGELRSDLEGAGFQQIESVDGAEIFQARTEDGQTAFVIVGDLGGAGASFDRQQPIDMDQQQAPGATPGQQQAPGATPDLPEPAPGTAPERLPQQ